MNGTASVTSHTPKVKTEGDDVFWLFEGRPEARDAIQERLEQFPEYAIWLQGLASGVIEAVELDAHGRTPATNPVKRVTFAP